MFLPPSPALSACDSLAGIDDLDAFLDSQGALSRFPTPPLNKVATNAASHDDVDTDSYDDNSIVESSPHTQELHISSLFLQEAHEFFTTSHDDQIMISHFFQRAQLPSEVAAIAFNIIRALKSARRKPGYNNALLRPLLSVIACAPLLVIAALSLATSHTSDHPPRNSWWSRHVCQCAWSAHYIDRAAMSLLKALDWDLLRFMSPDQVLLSLEYFDEAPAANANRLDNECNGTVSKRSSLRLTIENTSPNLTKYAHGLLTPVTPSPNAVRVLFASV